MSLNKDNNNRHWDYKGDQGHWPPPISLQKKINVFDCSCYIEEYYSKFMEEQMCHLISLSIDYAKYDWMTFETIYLHRPGPLRKMDFSAYQN